MSRTTTGNRIDREERPTSALSTTHQKEPSKTKCGTGPCSSRGTWSWKRSRSSSYVSTTRPRARSGWVQEDDSVAVIWCAFPDIVYNRGKLFKTAGYATKKKDSRAVAAVTYYGFRRGVAGSLISGIARRRLRKAGLELSRRPARRRHFRSMKRRSR